MHKHVDMICSAAFADQAVRRQIPCEDAVESNAFIINDLAWMLAFDMATCTLSNHHDCESTSRSDADGAT
jgi:hypothetical protein